VGSKSSSSIKDSIRPHSIASIMEELRQEAWIEIVARCQEVGVECVRRHFACPPWPAERRMGSAMGETPGDPRRSRPAGWMNAPKCPLVQNDPTSTHIDYPTELPQSRQHSIAGHQQDPQVVIGVNLETCGLSKRGRLHDGPAVTPSHAVIPIALVMCMEVAQVIQKDFAGRKLVGHRGHRIGERICVAQFILLAATNVQVSLRHKGRYRCVKEMLRLAVAAFN